MVGRTLQGIWLKLLEVSAREGVANIGAELDDSPFSLAITLVTYLHMASMTSDKAFERWQNQLESEVSSCVCVGGISVCVWIYSCV